MNKLFFTLFITSLTACNSYQTTGSSTANASNTADLQQYQDVLFCGSVDAFAKASTNIYEPLKSAWDKVLGEDNEDYCKISVSFDKAGVITNYNVIQCENPEAIPAVIKLASPVQVSENSCIFQRVQRVKYTINGSDENH